MTTSRSDSEEFRRVEALFHEAQSLAPEDRAAFLDRACPDAAQRREVERLLAGAAVDDQFLLNPQPDPAEPDLSGRQIGGFRLTKVLASGGMGTVYEAEQESPRRTVALKLMRPGLLSANAVHRFEYESQILARLRHPAVAQIFEAGTHAEGALTLPWFAMELIADARSLTEFARDLDHRARLQVFAQVCDAIQHGHNQGVIHRDLKPANLLVGGDGQPKVIDFGIARVTDDETATALHSTGSQLIGTLAYMSPEQCTGLAVELDTRTDVYSLGVVLYELICDALPYDVGSQPITEAVRVICEKVPRRPSRLRPHVHPDLDAVVMTALEKERDRRYTSCAELAADLRRHLADEPVRARTPGVGEQLTRLARRNKAVTAGIATAFVGLAIATIVSWRFAIRASDRATEALAATALMKEERDTTVQMFEFLRSLLEKGNPLTGPDRTVRELLDEACPLLATEFEGRPKVEAALRGTIGSAYWNLARFEEAERELQLAIDLLREVDRLSYDRDLTYLMTMLGLVQVQRGNTESAEITLAEALQRHRDRPESDLDTVHLSMTLTSLGSLAQANGDFHKAEGLHRDALELRRVRAAPAGDVDVAASLSNLATVLFQLNRIDEAIPMWQEALDLSREHGDPDSPFLARILGNYGNAVTTQGRFDEARAIYHETMEVQRRRLGAQHPDVASTIEKLAMCELKAGQPEVAIEHLNETHAMRSAALGASNPLTLRARTYQGYAMLHAGRAADAAALLEPTLSTQSRVLPAGHPDGASTRLLLGIALTRTDRAEDAMPHLEEAERIRGQVFGEDHARTANVSSAIGECLVALGRYDDAEPILLAAYPRILASGGPEDLETRAARERLVELYECLEIPEEAELWRSGSPDR